MDIRSFFMYPYDHESKCIPRDDFFGGCKGTQLEFRKKLACKLVHNTLDVDGAITRSLNTEKVGNNLHH